MKTSDITYQGKPESTAYDRARHAKMKLRSIGYGYHHVNRTLNGLPVCAGCGNEIEHQAVRYSINKEPYHKECFLNAGNKNS